MEKIIMLGTGHGFVWNLYNTCFLLENGKERGYRSARYPLCKIM